MTKSYHFYFIQNIIQNIEFTLLTKCTLFTEHDPEYKMYDAYTTYDDIWDTQNLYQENLYKFKTIHICTYIYKNLYVMLTTTNTNYCL